MQIEEIFEFMRNIELMHFATIENNQPRVRIMSLIPFNNKWYTTTKTPRSKVNQIKENEHFEFSFLLKQGGNIGSLRARGKAIIIEDLNIKKEISKEIIWFETYWKSFKDPSFCLIHLDIDKIIVQSPFDREDYLYHLKNPLKTEDPWRELLSKNLDEVVGDKLRKKIIPKDIKSSDLYTIEEKIDWTIDKIDKMDEKFTEEERNKILTKCAHIIPDSRVKEYKDIYEKNHSVDEVHSFMKENFISRLKARMDLKEEWMEIILRDNWGEAGYIEGNIIYATKMAANIKGYFEAESNLERNMNYCHCGRIRNVFKSPDKKLSPTYCNCGAGFYKSTWERVLGKPVEVKVIKSILKGDNVCKIAIYLPENL